MKLSKQLFLSILASWWGFIVTSMAQAPTITDFGNLSNPLFAGTKTAFGGCFAGPADIITLNGTNFLGVNSTSVNGINASFTVSSANLLRIKLPSYSTLTGKNLSGAITVRSPGGQATSVLTLTAVFCIDFGFATANVSPGTVLRVGGGDLQNVTGISVAGVGINYYFEPREKNLILQMPSSLPGSSVNILFRQGTYLQDPTFPFSFGVVQPPAISSVTTSAGAGTSVHIQGSGFALPSTQNSIFIDDLPVQAQPGGSSTSLSFVMPANANGGDITVVNRNNGLSATNTGAIVKSTPILGISTLTNSSFTVINTTSTGDDLNYVRAGDFNLDGKVDFVSTRITDQKVTLFLNTTPQGAFQPSFAQQDIMTFPTPLSGGANVMVHDVDADGKQDIVGVDNNSDLYIIRNISSSTGVAAFAPYETITITGFFFPTASPQNLRIKDLDMDGKPDLFTYYSESGVRHISAARNISEPGRLSQSAFAPFQDVITLTGGEGAELDLADMDGDGKLDFIFSDNGTSATFNVYRNVSTKGVLNSSSFTLAFQYAAPLSAQPRYFYGFKAFDINADNKTDLVTIDNLDQTVLMFENTGTGIGNIGFSPPYTVSIPGSTLSFLSVGNFDGENSGTPTQDLAVLGFAGVEFQVDFLRNTLSNGGSVHPGAFARGASYTIPGTVNLNIGLLSADLNYDGLMDALVVGPDREFTYFLNNICPQLTVSWPQYGTLSHQEGTSGTFDIALSIPGATYNYRWYASVTGSSFALPEDAVFAGVSTPGLSISSPPSSVSGYTLFVVLTPINGTCAPITSPGLAYLEVLPCYSPTVTSEPTSTLVCLGAPTSFAVGYTGTGIAVQWQEQVNGSSVWTSLSNAGIYSQTQSDNLLVSSVPAFLHEAQYRALLTGLCGTATSTGVVLRVNTGISLVSAPQSAGDQCAGREIKTFAVSALGYNLAYQWQIDPGSGFQHVSENSVFRGVNSAVLSVVSADISLHNKPLRVIISDNCTNTLVSDGSSTLSVVEAPSIVQQPSSPAPICANQGILSISISTQGAEPSYQWQVKEGNAWIPITQPGTFLGFNSSTIQVINPSLNLHSTLLRVSISGACLDTALVSDSAIISVYESVARILIAPTTTSPVCEDAGNGLFTVSALGIDVAYQWQEFANDWVDLLDGSSVQGATTSRLSLLKPSIALHNRPYRVRLRTSCGSTEVTSDGSSLLTVFARPSLSLSQNNTCTLGGASLTVAPSPNYRQYLWLIDDYVLIGDTLDQLPLLVDGSYRVMINSDPLCVSEALPYTLPTTFANVPTISAFGDNRDTLLRTSLEGVRYRWYANGRLLTGNDEASLKVYYNADYQVEVTYPDGCTGKSEGYSVLSPDYVDILRAEALFSDTSITLLSLPNQSVQVAPNPSEGRLSIKSQKPIAKVILTDAQGRTVLEKYTKSGEDTLDIQSLPGGIYTLIVYHAQDITRKIIIKK